MELVTLSFGAGRFMITMCPGELLWLPASLLTSLVLVSARADAKMLTQLIHVPHLLAMSTFIF